MEQSSSSEQDHLRSASAVARMNAAIIVLALACEWSAAHPGSPAGTGISSQFNEMIQLSTVTFSLANFTNYGCHCGPRTQGIPVDAIDRCCHSHDCCYNKAEMFGCTPRLHTYQFYAQRDKIKCVKSRDRCEKMVCECDQKAAGCFRKNLFSYNPQFKNHPGINCRAPRPFC